jgi:hypothetical protein
MALSFCEVAVVGTTVYFFIAEVDIEKRLRISTTTATNCFVPFRVVALWHLFDGSVTPPTECVVL